VKPQSTEQRLAADHFEVDQESHIHIDQAALKASGAAATLTAICPAHVYTQESDGSVTAEHAACLECGACAAVAPPDALTWHYPRGGAGVRYRHG
jgi:ferredoxin like protein